MADGLPERIVRAGGGSSDQGLELRECHLDRVQSGLQGGRNRNHAPTAFRAAAAVGLLCDDGLSRMIASPLCNLGANWVSTQRSNVSPFIAPSMTHGASSRLWRRAAMKVRVFQWPKGAWSIRRPPFGDQPVVLAVFVFSEVSPMKPMRGNRLRMKG